MRTLRNLLMLSAFALAISSSPGAGKDFNQILNQGLASLPSNFQNLSYAASATSIQARQDQAVAKVTPAVVSIYGVSNLSQPNTDGSGLDFFFRRGLGSSFSRPSAQYEKMSAGSGFFVDSDGYILTNKHVVSDTKAKYSVRLSDGTKKEAEVIYRDPAKDLAIVKVDGGNYPILALGDSSKLQVGQAVIGIGNAFGQFPNLTTTGRITSMHRNIVAEDESGQARLNDVIQTSAQLYPGDSGGPLFDLSGKVVGIDVATALDRSNVSFSIPINEAKDVIAKNVSS